MQLDNVAVQFEADLSSAGRNRAGDARRMSDGERDAFRIAAITRCAGRARTRRERCEPETGSMAAAGAIHLMISPGRRDTRAHGVYTQTYIYKNSHYRSARRERARAIAHSRGTTIIRVPALAAQRPLNIRDFRSPMLFRRVVRLYGRCLSASGHVLGERKSTEQN